MFNEDTVNHFQCRVLILKENDQLPLEGDGFIPEAQFQNNFKIFSKNYHQFNFFQSE